MLHLEIQSANLLVLMVYVIGMLVLFGWYLARKTRGGGSEDYFVTAAADRHLPVDERRSPTFPLGHKRSESG